MAGRQTQINREFLRRVDDYLPAYAEVLAVDADDKTEVAADVGVMNGNTFYVFDSDAMLAASHAVEDLALDEANGSLLATLQDFANFAPHRERYALLAATADDVSVVGCGRRPRRCGRVQFISGGSSAIRDFWTVLYQGRHTQALVMSRQTNQADLFEQRTYVGFYTFDARLIAKVRKDIEGLLGGLVPALREYDRLRAIDHTVKQVRSMLHQEQNALEHALERLQFGHGRNRTHELAGEIDRIVNRLQNLKSSLADIQRPFTPTR